MGIYSAAATFGSSIDMNYTDNTVFESTNFTALGLEAVAESEANYNAIMKAIGVHELSYYSENGVEIMYEASGISGFFAKIKEFFKKLFDKVKEIFHKFLAWINSISMDDKEFAKKYGPEIRKKWDKVKDTFKVKGYKFTNMDKYTEASAGKANTAGLSAGLNGDALEIAKSVAADQGASKSELDTKLDSINKIDDADDKIRAAMFNLFFSKNESTLTTSELATELSKIFRDDNTSKTDIDKNEIKIEACIDELMNSSTTKKNAENAYKVVANSIKDTIKKIEDIEKSLDKQKALPETTEGDGEKKDTLGARVAIVSKCVTRAKTVQETMVTIKSAYLTALKDQSRQNKAILAAIVGTGKVEESADYGYSESATSMDFLNSVVIK